MHGENGPPATAGVWVDSKCQEGCYQRIWGLKVMVFVGTWNSGGSGREIRPKRSYKYIMDRNHKQHSEGFIAQM